MSDNKRSCFNKPSVPVNTYNSSAKPKDWGNFRVPRIPRDQRFQNKQQNYRHASLHTSSRSVSYPDRKYGHWKPVSKWQCKYSSQMSRDTCGRSFDTFFDRMGKHNLRQMGSRFDLGRLQTGIHSKTFFLRHKRNSCPKLSNHAIRKRNREYFKHIERVQKKDSMKGFYSTLFLAPKKNGKMRPVINLLPLNRYLVKKHFKMDSMKQVIQLVEKGNWSITLDLADAFFHLKIFKHHRQYLRFSFKGKVFQFRVLTFGPTVAPRVF